MLADKGMVESLRLWLWRNEQSSSSHTGAVKRLQGFGQRRWWIAQELFGEHFADGRIWIDLGHQILGRTNKRFEVNGVQLLDWLYLASPVAIGEPKAKHDTVINVVNQGVAIQFDHAHPPLPSPPRHARKPLFTFCRPDRGLDAIH